MRYFFGAVNVVRCDPTPAAVSQTNLLKTLDEISNLAQIVRNTKFTATGSIELGTLEIKTGNKQSPLGVRPAGRGRGRPVFESKQKLAILVKWFHNFIECFFEHCARLIHGLSKFPNRTFALGKRYYFIAIAGLPYRKQKVNFEKENTLLGC